MTDNLKSGKDIKDKSYNNLMAVTKKI